MMTKGKYGDDLFKGMKILGVICSFYDGVLPKQNKMLTNNLTDVSLPKEQRLRDRGWEADRRTSAEEVFLFQSFKELCADPNVRIQPKKR